MAAINYRAMKEGVLKEVTWVVPLVVVMELVVEMVDQVVEGSKKQQKGAIVLSMRVQEVIGKVAG